MTAAERTLWLAVQRRALGLAPELAAAVLAAFAQIRAAYTESAIARAIQLGLLQQMADAILADAVRVAAYQAVQEALRRAIVDGVRYYGRTTVPVPPRSTLAIRFDVLNPKMVEAVRTLETRVIQSLDASIRQTVVQAVEDGLKAGVNPRTVARSLRQVIGLGPTQLEQLDNLRAKLEHAHERTDGLTSTASGKRYATVIDTARKTGTPIPPAKIDAIVEADRKRRIAQNAETIARTAALDAQKLAQRLAFEDAVEKGIVDRGRIRRRWVGVLDSRERPEHVAMEGETVGFDEPFSNGELVPGSSTYNCRCLARHFLA